MHRHTRQDEEEHRREYGGYSEAELDAALLDAERSDLPSVILRLAVVALVFYLLARSVLAGLSGPYLLLPLMLELLVIFWLGWAMSRTIVDCKVFRRSAGSIGLTLFWTAVAAVVLLAAFSYDGTRHELSMAHIAPSARTAWASILAHDLHWALLAMIAGLLVTTTTDVVRWKQRGGVFFWASITTAGFRVGLIILVGVVGAIPLMMFGEVIAGQIGRGGWIDALAAQQWAWPIWTALLLLDLGVVVLATAMHKDLLAKHAKRRVGSV